MSVTRPRLTTGGRVALTVVVSVALGVIMLSVLAYAGVSRRLTTQRDETLVAEVEAYAQAVSSSSGLYADGLASATRSFLAARSPAGGSTLIIVRLADGRLLSNSDVRLEDVPADQDILTATEPSMGFIDIEYEGEVYRSAHSSIQADDGTVLGVFQAAIPTSPIHETVAGLALTLALSGTLIVIISAVSSAMVARASLRPLRTAARTAEAVTHSTLGERIADEGATDEVGTMVRAVNSMLDRVEDAFATQKRFISDASHEMRTPLAAIRGHLEIANDPRIDPEDRKTSLTVVDEELSRMGRLVDDLLTLARLEGNAPRREQSLDLSFTAWEAAERARALAPGLVTYERAESVWVKGDPDHLLQAILNLAVNAVRHTGENGAVSLACESLGPDARVIVQDTGPGIAPEDLPHVFERFYRARSERAKEGGGTGLGLAITERLVRAHGGRISVENVPDGGARFIVTLPTITPPEDVPG
ncbi:MAG: HAMP domain-containing sensor histidine kinase [Coriobacteriia bacterium]|nr:HAMP domain-containing sensor histidine kinase [Coriobacteriia bacterium]